VEWFEPAILFGVGVLAGLINVMAGGGSTLTLPVLILIGLDSATANGTNRISLVVQNISAVASFRSEGHHDFRTSWMLGLLTLPGAIAGSFLSLQVSDLWFQRILAIIMIGVVLAMVTSGRGRFVQSNSQNPRRRRLAYIMMVAIGFYGGFIQVGVGYLLMAALYYGLQLSLVRVNMHKVFVVLVYTLPVVGVFAFTGNIHWLYGILLAAGTALGAWISVRLSIRGGEGVIKMVMGVAVVLMALKLLDVF